MSRLQNVAARARGDAYRPDIDGLRAVAVLSVVLYHLRLPAIPGGYVGVDIFFVISGYLITRNIWDEIQAGRFTLKAFYLRRIRRIAPAFLVMAAVTLTVGALIMLPADLRTLASATVAAALSASNLLFWKSLDIGYFAPTSDESPLLHTWSLGVEEQYYLLWPATLVLLSLRVAGRHRRATLTAALILVGSFTIAQLTLSDHPKFAYFLLPPRAGELMAGALIAILSDWRRQTRSTCHPLVAVGRWAAEGVGILGFLLVGFALTQLNDGSQFPGMNALFPTLGATLLLAAGGWHARVVTIPLASAPMVIVGLLSYSIYLWHWPVLAFLRYLYTDLNATQIAIAVVLIAGLSVASYVLVELPARTWRPSQVRQFVSLYAAPTTALVIAAGVVVATNGLKPFIESAPGFRDRLATLDAELRPAYAFPYNCQLATFDAEILARDRCTIGQQAPAVSGPSVLLWGDSNAAHYIGVLGAIAQDHGVSFRNASYSTCPPLFGGIWGTGAYRDGCGHFRMLIERAIDDGRYRTVVIGGQWSSYDRDPRFRSAIEQTVRTITRAGVRVVILGQVPVFPSYNPACESRALRIAVSCRDRVELTDAGDTEINRFLKRLAEQISGTRYLTARDLICAEGLCRPYLGQTPIYFNSNHLSMEGSWRVGAALASSPDGNGWLDAVWGDGSSSVPRPLTSVPDSGTLVRHPSSDPRGSVAPSGRH